MKYFLSLFIPLLVFSRMTLAQVEQDSSRPRAQATDTMRPVDTTAKKKPAVVRRKPAADSSGKTVTRTPADTLSHKKDTATTAAVDSFPLRNDSTRPVTPVRTAVHFPPGRLYYQGVLRLQPYYNCFASPQVLTIEERHPQGKETLFYLLTGMLLCLALIRVVFAKYISNLMALVFRASLKQKQIREQLVQTPLPSLLLNIFFVLVAGLYVVYLGQHYHFITTDEFWIPFFMCSACVGAVYVVKFAILKFTGWVFNMRDAANTYAFIVFLVNKLLGMFLLPLIILLWFSKPSWTMPLLTLSWILVFCLFAYRYIASFGPVRREVKVSPFHFFMYLCAFEIAPLLLIYKVLLDYILKKFL